MFKLFRKNRFINTLSLIISNTLSSFIYLLVILILFNFVYAIIGMQLFGGTFKTHLNIDNQFNFDTFWTSFLTAFDIVTLDNWIDLIALRKK